MCCSRFSAKDRELRDDARPSRYAATIAATSRVTPANTWCSFRSRDAQLSVHEHLPCFVQARTCTKPNIRVIHAVSWLSHISTWRCFCSANVSRCWHTDAVRDMALRPPRKAITPIHNARAAFGRSATPAAWGMADPPYRLWPVRPKGAPATCSSVQAAIDECAALRQIQEEAGITTRTLRRNLQDEYMEQYGRKLKKITIHFKPKLAPDVKKERLEAATRWHKWPLSKFFRIVWIDEKQEYLKKGGTCRCFAPPGVSSFIRETDQPLGKCPKLKYEAAVAGFCGPVYFRAITGTTKLARGYRVRTVPRRADFDPTCRRARRPCFIQDLHLVAAVSLGNPENTVALLGSPHANPLVRLALLVAILLLADEVMRAIPVDEEPSFGGAAQRAGAALKKDYVHAVLVHGSSYERPHLMHKLAPPLADAMRDNVVEQAFFAVGEPPWLFELEICSHALNFLKRQACTARKVDFGVHRVRVQHFVVLHAAAAAHALELERPLGGRRRTFPALQNDVRAHQLRLGSVLRLAAAFLNAAVLQVKKAAKKGKERKLAKGMTQEEWTDELALIIRRARELRDDDKTFHKVIFMSDNPRFHQLEEVHFQQLLLAGDLVSRDQIQYAPRYSGDFMQCIEHVHAIICRKWWIKRMKDGMQGEWEVWESELRSIFFGVIDAAGVQANCAQVRELAEHVFKANTGDYADPRLV